MAVDLIMPALELAQETGKVLRWFKAPGDAVQKGEPVVEIETDKVVTELEAPASGVLGDVTAREGDVVPVGRAIARIVEAPGGAGAGPDRGMAAGADGAGARLPAASPKARRLAAEHGVDLAALAGSGPGGAVLAADVTAGAERGHAAAREPATAAAPTSRSTAGVPGPSPVAPPPSARRGAIAAAGAETPGTVWRIMAERMTASWTTAPHFYLVREVDATRLGAWRERAGRPLGARVTYTDLLVKLAAAALVRHPAANTSWKDGTLLRHAEVNIGLAVAVDDGLVVPVLHRADTLGVAEIAARREDLVARAQAGKLRPADIQGGVFTISNLGVYGVDAFSAIVNPPQAAILAVGRIAERVVAMAGQPAVRPTMVLTLSCDHRALDGARAAQFLSTLADLIEEPLALLG